MLGSRRNLKREIPKMQNRALKHLNSKDEQVLLEGEKRCENCKRLEDKIDQKFQELADRTNHQNTIIMEALAEQNVLINRLIFQDEENLNVTSTFPIKSDNELKELDQKIDDSNIKNYVNIVKKIICNNLQKNIDLLLEPEFLYEYNIDGSHGKKRLKEYKMFEVMKDCVISIYGAEGAEEKIRKAIHLSKKRQLKKLLTNKRNATSDDNK
ncbi:PREDICTED: uncharacterized protein LOC108376342 isoform X1 [Rhagoletis zephyria]|uniref:uncharacterized protein LOC108376342 isoform X1 n=2 Tax=Rhagoletis zephyria TaxID=28612 RepID=UPI00081189F8|nr:PREDICTED: uncharacterized protein LOC108376342 isoform X1 [Rhagoletis zephyria]XP_017488045.1 PREDICTED: uncharacterized protein LOC108376342 isoform X1 [Rhagoletis zephyria]XP_036325368.1 uncharacterized protein LOC118738539 isoform X1 [Rhagoletis pomonella]XP_036336134.1 uncharacterized protein LOC118746387 isoform X1 [Rhagoletis pomonella]XP_036336135.1 uncharacterized protein LOC118746387 isoform X1 [Rhagoletis pomonella]XP_036339212.1 uncharacterized protein LOC118748699 isoform X1 [R